jgi:zinc/manganese transport system substrate-binding protein
VSAVGLFSSDDEARADPHLWFDPDRVSTALPALAAALIEEAGADRTAVNGCLAEYQATLSELDAEIARLVAELARSDRTMVTNHDSLGYFADRYGFEILGTVIPSSSSLAETNPAQLESLAELIEREGVGAIFAESQQSRADADALSSRLGDIEVVTLFTGTLDTDGTEAGTYVGFLRSNAELITAALAGV